jgi:hypothetical protein
VGGGLCLAATPAAADDGRLDPSWLWIISMAAAAASMAGIERSLVVVLLLCTSHIMGLLCVECVCGLCCKSCIMLSGDQVHK